MDELLYLQCKDELDEFISKFKHYSWLTMNMKLKQRTNKLTVDLWANRDDNIRFFAFRILINTREHFIFFRHLLVSLGNTILLTANQDDVSTEAYSSESGDSGNDS